MKFISSILNNEYFLSTILNHEYFLSSILNNEYFFSPILNNEYFSQWLKNPPKEIFVTGQWAAVILEFEDLRSFTGLIRAMSRHKENHTLWCEVRAVLHSSYNVLFCDSSFNQIFNLYKALQNFCFKTTATKSRLRFWKYFKSQILNTYLTPMTVSG